VEGEVSLLTRLDMTDDENVKDARHKLERASTDIQLAEWAREYGAAFVGCDLIDSLEDERDAAESDATEAEKERDAALRANEELIEAIEIAVAKLDDLGKASAIADELRKVLD
jgi:hypothetical protein